MAAVWCVCVYAFLVCLIVNHLRAYIFPCSSQQKWPSEFTSRVFFGIYLHIDVSACYNLPTCFVSFWASWQQNCEDVMTLSTVLSVLSACGWTLPVTFKRRRDGWTGKVEAGATRVCLPAPDPFPLPLHPHPHSFSLFHSHFLPPLLSSIDIELHVRASAWKLSLFIVSVCLIWCLYSSRFASLFAFELSLCSLDKW